MSTTDSQKVPADLDASTWKSLFSQKLASKRITEEFEYFAKIYASLDKNEFKGPNAVLYALDHAAKRTEANDLVDGKKRTDSLPEGSKVCIVGAGMAGLYIAMILDELNIPNLSYEILEGSDRVGGRVYTHYFSEETHDYYDVGAMRFPKIPIMQKTFNLFEHLGTTKVPLINYYMSSPKGDSKHVNQPSRYNDKTVIGYDEKKAQDDFQVSEEFGGRIMSELVKSPSKYVSEAFEPFKDRLRKNWNKGFQALMKYDEFSVRGFMMSHGITPLDDYYSIQWLETMTDGSGLYDQGFSEGVVDSMDFDYFSEYIGGEEVAWFCVDGGTQLVPDAMNAALKNPLTKENLGKRVTKIAIDREGDKASMKVQVSGEAKPRDYMTVFATPTLACMQRIDLTGLELLYEQKDAIRALHYDTATKVGMQFKTAWWIEMGIKGGLGKTDMPLRTCVYPSYNIDDPHGKPAVLLCSYSWAQDAARLGSLIKGKWEEETELKETLFNNLTWLHIEHYKQKNDSLSEKEAFDALYKVISDSYIKHHAFDWHNHEWTSGAYGKFGPGQFSKLYPSLTSTTADSRFHFVGEAVSEHHGWIVGALDSAHQAVLNFLRRFNLKEYEEKLADMKWTHPIPEGIDKESSVMKVILGLLDPERRLMARREVEKGKAEGVKVEGAASETVKVLANNDELKS